MQGQAARFGRAELSRAADIVNAALTEMTGATSPRLHLELICARLLLPAADDAERGLRARVDRIERRLDMTSPAGDRPAAARPAPAPAVPAVPVAPAAPPAAAGARLRRRELPRTETRSRPQCTPSRSARSSRRRCRSPLLGPAVPSTSPGASEAVPEMGPGAGGTESIRRMWPDVMGRLGGIKRTTWSLVSHYAQVLDYDGTRLLLQFDSPGRAALFGKGAHQEFLRQALIDIMGIDCRFEATAGDAPAAAARRRCVGGGPAPCRCALRPVRRGRAGGGARRRPVLLPPRRGPRRRGRLPRSRVTTSRCRPSRRPTTSLPSPREGLAVGRPRPAPRRRAPRGRRP